LRLANNPDGAGTIAQAPRSLPPLPMKTRVWERPAHCRKELADAQGVPRM